MERINKILVATDFSSNGAKAVNYGATLAAQIDAELSILHVEDDRQKSYLSLLSDYASYDAYIQDQFDKIDSSYLNFKKLGHTFIKRKGVVSQVIISVAQEESIDLIIVGISGLNKGFELEFGSVTLKVLNNLTCPIIVVPENYQTLSLNTLLVATDHQLPDKENDNDVIDYFIREFDSQVYLINVAENGEVHSENYRRLVDKTTPFEHSSGVLVKNEEIIKQLISEVDKQRADLMVIFRRKKSLTSGTFMPRLSNLLALNMTVPILFIPCETMDMNDENHEAS